jgi:hypothetical protein
MQAGSNPSKRAEERYGLMTRVGQNRGYTLYMTVH